MTAHQSSRELILRYLEDAIAAERNFEGQLRTFAKEGDIPDARALFADHAMETKRQYERLEARLQELGGKTGPSTAVKSLVAQFIGLVPKAAQIAQYESEVSTQNLIMAYSVENSEIAMYEALAVAASSAGDAETEALARSIQREEKQSAEKIWHLLSKAARTSYVKVTGEAARTPL